MKFEIISQHELTEVVEDLLVLSVWLSACARQLAHGSESFQDIDNPTSASAIQLGTKQLTQCWHRLLNFLKNLFRGIKLEFKLMFL